MRATRVLMTADTVGGVWTYALDLARLLHQPDNHFGLAVTDIARIAAYLRRLEQKPVEPVREPGGAEGSAILIDTARRQPPE